MSHALAIVEGVFGRACLLHKDRRVGPHAHAEPHMVLMVDGDDFAYEVDGAVAPCSRGHVVLVNAMELHANHSIGRAPSVILSLYISPPWLARHHASLLAGGRLFQRPTMAVTPPLRTLADRLAAAMRAPALAQQGRLQFLVSELVFMVFEQVAGPQAPLERIARLNDYRIRRAISLMRASVGQPFDLAGVAARVGLSRSRFFELFPACTGLSPKHYLDMLRMEVATQALARSDRSIAEIGEGCGYAAQSHFTRFFLHRIGITPSEYRRAAGMLS